MIFIFLHNLERILNSLNNKYPIIIYEKGSRVMHFFIINSGIDISVNKIRSPKVKDRKNLSVNFYLSSYEYLTLLTII